MPNVQDNSYAISNSDGNIRTNVYHYYVEYLLVISDTTTPRWGDGFVNFSVPLRDNFARGTLRSTVANALLNMETELHPGKSVSLTDIKIKSLSLVANDIIIFE